MLAYHLLMQESGHHNLCYSVFIIKYFVGITDICTLCDFHYIYLELDWREPMENLRICVFMV
jgi:hypothetical protein